MDASHVYVGTWALGCFHSHSTQTFRRELTASVDSCAEIKSALQWRNQIWQSLEEAAGKRCPECDSNSAGLSIDHFLLYRTPVILQSLQESQLPVLSYTLHPSVSAGQPTSCPTVHPSFFNLCKTDHFHYVGSKLALFLFIFYFSSKYSMGEIHIAGPVALP